MKIKELIEATSAKVFGIDDEELDVRISTDTRTIQAGDIYLPLKGASFDGEKLELLEIGAPLTIELNRGLYEPSIVCYEGTFYLTLRNDECGFVAKSVDGLNYTNLQLWKWKDGSIVQTYNTQQHWMTVGDELYLVYTRRAENNDHIFRHRAPLFAAKVENMRLVKETEFVAVCEQGARLGNFGVTEYKDGQAIVMAAELMDSVGCEKYGSDNNIFLSKISL